MKNSSRKKANTKFLSKVYWLIPYLTKERHVKRIIPNSIYKTLWLCCIAALYRETTSEKCLKKPLQSKGSIITWTFRKLWIEINRFFYYLIKKGKNSYDVCFRQFWVVLNALIFLNITSKGVRAGSNNNRTITVLSFNMNFTTIFLKRDWTYTREKAWQETFIALFLKIIMVGEKCQASDPLVGLVISSTTC